MTKSYSLSEIRAQLGTLSESPIELTVTKRGEPVFSILPYEMYEAFIETLDIVADHRAINTLRENLETLRSNKPVIGLVVNSPPQDEIAPYTLSMTKTAKDTFETIRDPQLQAEISEYFKALSLHPEAQGKQLVGALKRYRSIRAANGSYQIIFTIEGKNVLLVFIDFHTTENDNQTFYRYEDFYSDS